MKLSKIQKRALQKLTANWQSAYSLGESLATLNSLVKKKLAKETRTIGSLFFPRTTIYFKRN